MNEEAIKSAIVEAILQIAPEVEADEIEPDANIQRSLEIDSFDFLKILTALNEKLGIEVPESDYAEVDTLNRMARYFVAHS
jgi:acyl carrier protein